MATIHFSEIQKILADRGEKDALPHPTEGHFVEIRFDEPAYSKNLEVIDEEFKNKVITADCPYGTVTIQFDEKGELKSLDIC